jgi:2-keto-3-deoxy-6-phosphogluconate aldolase
MTRRWNTLVPVVAVVSAETADEAVSVFRAQVAAAGFDVYEGGEPGCGAFES